MVTTRPPKTIVKPTALGPVANTDTKLLIYGLFQKGRVLAQDGVKSSFWLRKQLSCKTKNSLNLKLPRLSPGSAIDCLDNRSYSGVTNLL